MNAESLIGTTLGTCTLQKLIGQGGMGAVFLAQQSRPRRQVAVKVLLPMTPLAPHQQVAFLERFRRETDAAASLVHPNIIPVHEYAEQGGLAYLVMPYVGGGTLRDELETSGPLPFVKVMNYLDQVAAALEVAHGRGVIHRDIKPANIMKTLEGRLVLTDFGLVKIVAEGQSAQARLTGIGVPMGTPDYMAPEQVLGSEIDARADLYSLGVILYQMVTGTVPFKADLPMQVAMQQVHVAPPSPRSLRPDLPIAAEQVIMRALAKNPNDRYPHVQDVASAFRQSLVAAGVWVEDPSAPLFSSPPKTSTLTSEQPYKRRSLFDPVWQDKGQLDQSSENDSTQKVRATSPTAQVGKPSRPDDLVAKTSMTLPSFSGLFAPKNAPSSTSMGLLQQSTPSTAASNNFPRPALMQNASVPAQEASQQISSGIPSPSSENNTPLPPTPQTQLRKKGLLGLSGELGKPSATPIPDARDYSPPPAPELPEQPTAATTPFSPAFPGSPAVPTGFSGIQSTQALPYGATGVFAAPNGVTGALMLPNAERPTSTMRLMQSVKVVQVPVSGQPGRYMTGMMPVLPATPEPEVASFPYAAKVAEWNTFVRKNLKVVVLIAAIVLVLFSSSVLWLIHLSSDQAAKDALKLTPTVNVAARASMSASATAAANTILTDALDENMHNWPVSLGKDQVFVFKNGAYHITPNDNTHSSIALLPDETFSSPLVYTLSVQEINGNDASIYNKFGMVMRYNIHQNNGKTVTTFYSFDVTNLKDGQYEFRKYDDSYGPTVSPYTRLWGQAFGPEYHVGHGKNTFKIIMNKNKFTFIVNDKQVGTAQDDAFADGQIGMFVNLNGTEVAFSNLILTDN